MRAQNGRISLYRRSFVGILAVAAIAAGSLTSLPSASADSTGYISIGARICALPTNYPIDECGVASVGALSLVEYGAGSQVLAMDEASYAGDNLVWGDVADVPLKTYVLDTQYMDVPDGFQLAEFIPVSGEAGIFGDGRFVTLTDASPSVEAYVIYRPAAGVDTDGDGLNDMAEVTIGTDPYVADIPGPDSDGDGAPDDTELAYGTDPYDANSWPEGVQAGPSDENGNGINDDAEDSDGDGASDEAEIAFGSDPYDAQDFPAVQAGPSDENGNGINDDVEDMDGDGVADAEADEALVTSLPNTGSGVAPIDGASEAMLLSALAVAMTAGGLMVLRGRNS
ncbi:hypothetical protein BH09CHL1_BH09CHL1_17200 [soil metagenome]